MPTDSQAYREGFDAGMRSFRPALLEPPTSDGHREAVRSVFWAGGLAAAAAGYRPEDDAQAAEDFFAGFVAAIAEAEDEAEHL